MELAKNKKKRKENPKTCSTNTSNSHDFGSPWTRTPSNLPCPQAIKKQHKSILKEKTNQEAYDSHYTNTTIYEELIKRWII